MSSNERNRERSAFNKICSILIDIFVAPIVIIGIICASIMISAKANGNVPSILGNSIMVIQTSSMDTNTDQSYKVGDVIIIDQGYNLDNLKVGDCIAFIAPEASGFVNDNGKPLPIFHRIIRIVYQKDQDTQQLKRFFVCHGDSVPGFQVVPAEPEYDASGNPLPVGDYDENGNVLKGGGYVAKLVSDQSIMQYVVDDAVIGKLKDRASGLISGLIKFCSSSLGVIMLVIIPSSIMIGIIVINMIQESKRIKLEEQAGMSAAQQLVTANGFNAGNLDGIAENDNENKNSSTEDSSADKNLNKTDSNVSDAGISKTENKEKAQKVPVTEKKDNEQKAVSVVNKTPPAKPKQPVKVPPKKAE